MSATMRPVTFANSEGHRLFGVLHEPVTRTRDAAIVLLSPGVKSRVAPHRLYVKMAAAFAEMGFAVLRFDFYGLGDSEGTVDEPMLADLYGSVQLGRYAEDTRCAVSWCGQELGVERVVLAGLCGGAISGLIAARDDRRVSGLLALGIPAMLDGSNIDRVAAMTRGQLTSIRTKYFRKLLDPAAWKRLLRLQTDLRLLTRSLAAGLLSRKPKPAAGPSGGEGAAAAANANPLFRPSLLAMLNRRAPVLLLFSEADRLHWEFEEKFAEPHRQELAAHGRFLDVQVVPEANHVFTFPAWQADMLARSRAWLDQRFPKSPAKDTASGAGRGQDTRTPSSISA